MGGGGGGGYSPPRAEILYKKIEKAREEERSRLEGEINQLLQRELSQFNDRDVQRTRERIDHIAEVLGGEQEVDTLLFGGSVAKHTYVDGLSDVDALVVLDREGTQGVSAQGVLDNFFEDLNVRLRRGGVEIIEKGNLAVTIRYTDGSEVQLLPAVRVGQALRIPDASGQGWNQTDPQRFRAQLTEHNQRLHNNLIPTVKLVKSLVSDLPEQQRPSGYHVESLALDAVRNYTESTTPKALLDRVLKHASERVLSPIRDVTGQSRNVDDYLGTPNSAERKLVSQALGGLRRRLNAATSIHQWRAMFKRSEQ